MAQSKPTKAEKAWLEELQELLDRCPSKRLGFYTIGDPSVSVYDCSKDAKIYEIADRGGDFGNAVDKAGARLGDLTFPFNVHSTSG